MNHALKAVIALVMGVGLAAGAQAHGNYTHHARTMSQRQMQMSQQQPQMRLSRQQIKTAQQQLKADGLYKGQVTGKFDRNTRMAVARFQQQNGLQRTAKLDRQTLDRLTGNQAVGVGSSTPKASMSNRNANGSGSSNNNATTPMVPPADNGANTGAGNSTGTTDQNPTNNK